MTGLRRIYYGLVGTGVLGLGLAATLGGADAGTDTPLVREAAVSASGYGTDAAGVAAPPEDGAGLDAAVAQCLDAAQDGYGGEVVLAAVNRSWQGREGWIVDLSLDVAEDGARPRRRDVACRQGEHGLQVARS